MYYRINILLIWFIVTVVFNSTVVADDLKEYKAGVDVKLHLGVTHYTEIYPSKEDSYVNVYYGEDAVKIYKMISSDLLFKMDEAKYKKIQWFHHSTIETIPERINVSSGNYFEYVKEDDVIYMYDVIVNYLKKEKAIKILETKIESIKIDKAYLNRK